MKLVSPVRLAVMDWGVGGLSVMNELARRLPKTSMLYFSDSGTTPYGKVPRAALRARVREVILSLEREYGTKHVVVACNAASTVLPSLDHELLQRGIHVMGVIEPGIALAKKSGCRNLGIIGGRRTILSRRFTNALSSRSVKAVGRIAQPLSALIERGELDSELMLSTLRQILRPLRNCDGLLLACTHYAAVKELIGALLPNCKVLDPAAYTSELVVRAWGRELKAANSAPSMFLTTGDARAMKHAALKAFGTRLAKPKTCAIVHATG